MKYLNEAGNEYMITEVQYFISDLEIHYQDGSEYSIEQDMGIHYIDSDIPETATWEIDEEIPAGVIDSISFTFGLDEATNITGLFPDAPESNMIWPDQLGGGYHYMKLNGKWLTVNNETRMFNFHLGIGQLYDDNGQVTEFVQNYFRANTYLAIYSSFIASIEADQMNHLSVNMNIDSWFATPNTWDFDQVGGMIMQNQEAQQAAKENGFDVFAIGPYVP
jgi:frataxin-like iron-binding protein CyaY